MTVLLSIKVTPNASRSRFTWDAQGTIKCYIQSQAVDGKANEALIDLIARKLSIGKRAVSIVQGEKTRFKTISIEAALSEQEVLQLLGLERQDLCF